MAPFGLGITGRLTLEISVGKIVKGYGSLKGEQIVDATEKGLLYSLPVTHEQIRGTIEPHQGNPFKVDIDEFAKCAFVLKPAQGGQLASRRRHAPDNASKGAGTLTCVHAG